MERSIEASTTIRMAFARARSRTKSVANNKHLQQELADVRAELEELRSQDDNPFALVDDDHYWSLCVRERQLLRACDRQRMDRCL
jgi:alkylation response protein AidB-like acyl-CoA dehydrogenase